MNMPDTVEKAAARAEARAETREHGTPFKQMTRAQKTRFILKLMVCTASFGFIFANVMND